MAPTASAEIEERIVYLQRLRTKGEVDVGLRVLRPFDELEAEGGVECIYDDRGGGCGEASTNVGGLG